MSQVKPHSVRFLSVKSLEELIRITEEAQKENKIKNKIEKERLLEDLEDSIWHKINEEANKGEWLINISYKTVLQKITWAKIYQYSDYEEVLKWIDNKFKAYKLHTTILSSNEIKSIDISWRPKGEIFVED